MNIFRKTLRRGTIAVSVSAVVAAVYAGQFQKGSTAGFLSTSSLFQDTSANKKDTTRTHYKISETNPQAGHQSMDLQTPPVLRSKVQLDSTMKYYRVTNQVDTIPIGDEQKVPFDQYVKQSDRKWMQEYFKKRSLSQTSVQGTGNNMLTKYLGDEENVLGKIGELVEIRPQGSAELTFSEDFNRVANPSWSLREQRNNQFKFDQRIQVNVTGNIANYVKLGINYDTHATFDFENQKKISFEGKEDDIIKSIQVGDVSMPISGSLITGSQTLFGIKTKLQFGKLDVTAVFAQQKSEKKEITLENGAQRNNFKISSDNYDERRHYFLGQYFRDHFDEFNRNWPALSSIQVTRLEVWVTNTNGTPQNTRSIAAFQDLGEADTIYNRPLVISSTRGALPDNTANGLFNRLTGDPNARYEKSIAGELKAFNAAGTVDYELLSNARQLAPTEFTFNPRLGFISLNYSLQPGEVLAVAYEYTENGQRHQVGEFSNTVPPDPAKTNVLFLKLLKSTTTNTHLPMWKLMMKNIYSLNAYQVQSTDFRLQVIYADDQTGTALNYLPLPSGSDEPAFRNGAPLIRALNLDRFNSQQERKPDGNFDYLEGVTIISSTGRVIFPVVEPFGRNLEGLFHDKSLANKYVFKELYDSTKAGAQQIAQKNKFFLQGSYRSASGAEISLNAINVPQGSVKVFSCGAPLREGPDFIVDYNLGRVKIINESVLNSGCVIKVEAESKSLFSIQQKTLMGTRFDYHFNKDFTVGGTFLYLRERPLTPKGTLGDDAIRNAIWGVDAHYRTDSRFLTQLVDRIPLIQTKEKSELYMEGEFAQNLPGHAQLQNDPNSKGGVSYLDDFEGSSIPYDLRLGNYWFLSSIPQKQISRFPEAQLSDNLITGFRRARLSWYTIDNSFFLNNDLTPPNIRNNFSMQSDPYMREVKEKEVYPNKQIPQGSPGTLPTFDIMYLPKERGPYNYTVDGLGNDGKLLNPTQSWGGITRKIETTDFEAANIEYITFWVMDPFIKNPNQKGQMMIDLGTISEDILKDNRESYENGLPKDASLTNIDSTNWGIVPTSLHITNTFDNDPSARPNQDVGYDGLTDEREKTFNSDYLNKIKAKFAGVPNGQNIINGIEADPAADNFRFFRGGDLDNASANILERYRLVNNVQGNTPVNQGGNVGYGTTQPDDEDINKDFNIEKDENYFEYQIDIDKNKMQKGRGFVTDVQTVPVTLANKSTTHVTWYQFKVPVRQFDRRVGSISDFKSIRFMRMYFSGFQDTLNMRFAQLQLVRSDWRKYLGSLQQPGDTVTRDPNAGTFEVATVNLEENGKRPGIPYVLPPGIARTTDFSTPDLIQQNEQSLSLTVCDLAQGDARAIFKNTTYDIRLYKHLKLFVHAEAKNNANNVKNGDLNLFVRVGADFTGNYYEYEMPLVMTKSPNNDKSAIWPNENQINLALEELLNAKITRNIQGVPFTTPFTVQAQGSRGFITVVGNPDLGNVRTIMIGVRHPKDNQGPVPCTEIWLDELRVTDFDEHGGWAATGRVVAKLADFAQVELTGSRRTIGFGGIEQSLQQRSQTDSRTFSIGTTMQLGMFFPKRYNVRIPMYASYAEQVNIPRYNPYSPDLPLSSLTNKYADSKQRLDSILKASEDFTARKSLNFTGVQKMRGQGVKKTHIYDIENLNATYIYSEIYRRNITNVYDIDRQYAAQLGYNYNFNAKPVTPFTGLKSKYLKLISDFNFYYLPQSFSMTARVDRRFAERLYRNTESYKAISDPLFDKTFQLGRKYDFRYNLTRSLKLSYSASALSRIEEPYGHLDTKEKVDTVRRNLLKLGNLTTFSQLTQLTYDVPIGKLPMLDWTTLQTNYTGSFDWQTAPPAAKQLGNTIQNAQTIGFVGQLNFITLYNKNSYLRNILNGTGNTGKKNIPKQAVTGKTGEEEQAPQGLSTKDNLIGLLLSLRNASFNYTINNGTLLPGFTPTPQALGQDYRVQAPGFPFIFGSQNDIRPEAVSKGWLSRDTTISTQFLQSHKTNLNGQITLEPLKSLRIIVEFLRQESLSHTETFRMGRNGTFSSLSPVETGAFSMSFMPILTMFVSEDKSTGMSRTFQNFEDYRRVISGRLSQQDPRSRGVLDVNGYYLGYGPYQQDVLLSSFVAAYTGKNPNSVSLSPFPKIPAPNWRLTYSGLTNFKIFRSFSKSISISHAYKSTYTIGNYRTDLEYDPSQSAVSGVDLISQKRIDAIAISEGFQPLLGVDINWINSWTSRFEYRKDRTLSLSFSDRRLTENAGQELILGAGYRTNKLYIPFYKPRGNRYYLDNDFNFRFDFSIRDNKQSIHILDQKTANSTGGQQLLSFTPNITYALSKNLTLDVFLKRTVTTPHTSNQYPTSFTSVGFKLRYVLTP